MAMIICLQSQGYSKLLIVLNSQKVFTAHVARKKYILAPPVTGHSFLAWIPCQN
jgi:hypothetical protein